MARTAMIDPQQAEGKAKKLLDTVQAGLGTVPNIFKIMAHAPAALEAYLGVSGALARGVLDKGIRERLALAIGQANGCGYCVAAHTVLGKAAGLGEEEILTARRGGSADAKADAALKLAAALRENSGHIDAAALAAARDGGLSDPEITEVVAHVALNVLTNYFNGVWDPDVDFPAAPPLT